MPLTLNQMRDNTAKARAAMRRARDGHYAMGAFNLDNQDILKAICQAAVNKRAPVLVEVSQGEVEAMGIDNVRDLVDNYKRSYGIEMYVNLDHSPSVEAAKAGIEAGFEFIHIDVSQADHEASEQQIIDATKQVVDYAKLTGAVVESEPHYFGGGSNVFTTEIDYEAIKKTFSTPEGAHAFVVATGIDTYAAAIGNLHGKYPVPKVLDLDLLQRVREAIDCNISLHGGSGTPGHYFESAVRIGVSKININSDMRYVYRKTLEEVLRDNPDEYAVVKLMDRVIAAVQAVVESKIDSFGSANQAQV